VSPTAGAGGTSELGVQPRIRPEGLGSGVSAFSDESDQIRVLLGVAS